jgi:hypothetical protein
MNFLHIEKAGFDREIGIVTLILFLALFKKLYMHAQSFVNCKHALQSHSVIIIIVKFMCVGVAVVE